MFVVLLLVSVRTAKPFTNIISMKLFTGLQLTSDEPIKLNDFKKNLVNYILLNNCNGTIGQSTFRDFPQVSCRAYSPEYMIKISKFQLSTLTLWKSNVTSINGTFTSITTLYVLKSHFQARDKDLLVKFPNLRELILLKNTNLLVDPLQFSKLKNLQLLHISDANFTEPCVTRRWFYNMEKLRELVLNDNHIKCIEEDAFSSLKHLKKLDLTYNNIAKLGEFVFNPLITLQQLGLYGNKLEGFQMEMLSSQRMHLKDLGVDWTVLRDSKVKPEDLMRMMHGLKKISFGNVVDSDKDGFCQNLSLLGGECSEDAIFALSRML